MLRKITHADFLEKLYSSNIKYANNEFVVLGEYESAKVPLLIQSKYGKCLVTPDSMLRKGVGPTISTAIDKKSFAESKLRDRNKKFDDGIFKIVSNINNTSDKVVTEDEYGLCEIILNELFQGKSPCVSSAIDKQTYFINMCLNKNTHVKNGDIFNIGTYNGMKDSISATTKYGDVLYKEAQSLFHDGLPTIDIAINKTEYFKNILKEKNSYYYEGLFEVVGEYTYSAGTIDVEFEGFLFRTNPMSLLKNHFIDPRSCLQPKEYFIYRANKIHNGKYDYTKSDYKSAKTPTTITCKVHKDFTQTPDSHLRGCGCRKCIIQKPGIGYTLYNWKSASLESNYFDSYKTYVIRCSSDDEVFYKVGITFRDLKQRINSRTIPYKTDVVRVYEFPIADQAYKLEKMVIKGNKSDKYKPKIEFPGGTMECFSVINLEKLDEWYQNSLNE